MNKILKLVLQGLGTVLPLGLTGYFLFWLFANAENYSKSLLLWLIPQSLYFPGLGIIATILVLFLIGLVVNAYGVRYLLHLSDRLFARIPLVKSVYGAIQDMMRVFSLAEKKQMKTVVSLDVGNDLHVIGFITGEGSGKRLFPDESSDRVGVYIPMSYQIGGFTLYVQRSRLTLLDIGVEEAMRIAITGGVQGSKS
ncbi:MAG: DUF502 domain-containing protein [Porticoccaceae bacterium]|nr:DUF502 domain-containing protein [Porticoccaceae bacterium]